MTFRQRHFVAGRVEQGCRGLSDFGIVEVHERIVKQHNLARGIRNLRVDLLLEPGFKRLPGNRRQIPSRVDAKKSIATLRGPKGRVADVKVEDPAVLKEIKAGDKVVAVIYESAAISVEPAAAAKKK